VFSTFIFNAYQYLKNKEVVKILCKMTVDFLWFCCIFSLEWEKLFTKPAYLRHLRNYAIKGNLRSSRFRSISWKVGLISLRTPLTYLLFITVTSIS